MNYDLSAFSGHWPFRRLRRSSLPQLLDTYAGLGISGGILSSLDAIFYNDPWEADGPLLERLTGTNWQLAMCVNPDLPWAESAVRRAHALGVRFLRLYPGIHGYPASAAEDVCRLAAKLGMALLVTGRMEDDRLCYLLRQMPALAPDWAELARSHPDVPMLLTGFYLDELAACGPVPENLWADTSGLCHGLAPVQTLLDRGFSGKRVVFGSLSPLLCPESQLLNLPENLKHQILSANPRRFLEVPHDRI